MKIDFTTNYTVKEQLNLYSWFLEMETFKSEPMSPSMRPPGTPQAAFFCWKGKRKEAELVK